ncbi:MAG: PAS domain S-box protein [Saprospiraceae bacterium]|nr:PAS domain S-box protein [Saprospiraceae bacterium]
MMHNEEIQRREGPSRAPKGVCTLELDDQGVILAIEDQLPDTFDWNPHDFVGKSFVDSCDLRTVGAAGKISYTDLFETLHSGSDLPDGVFALKGRTGLYRPLQINAINRHGDSSTTILQLSSVSLDSHALIATLHQGIFDRNPRISLQKFLLHVSHLFGVPHLYIGRPISAESTKIEVLASVLNSEAQEFGPIHDIAGSPCYSAYQQRKLVHYHGNVTDEFPDAVMAVQTKSEYFSGIPVLGQDGDVLCHISLLGHEKFRDEEGLISVALSFSKWMEVQCSRIYQERELVSAHNDYRDLFDNVYDGILHLDAEGNLIRANKAMRRFIDMSADKAPLEYVHQDDRKIVMALRDEVREKGYVESKRFRTIDPDGNLLHVEVSAVANYDEEGTYMGMREIIRDISEEVLAQKVKDKSQQDLQIIFDRSLVGLARIEKRIFTRVNPHFAAILGYTEEQLLGRKAADFIAEDDLDLIRKIVRQLEAGKPVVSTTAHFVHQDGHTIPTSCSLNRLSADDGSYLGILATVHDLSGRMAAERALRKSQEEYRSLIETSPVGILRLDSDLRIEFMSNQIREMHRLSLAQKELEFFNLVDKPARGKLFKILSQLQTDQSEAIEFSTMVGDDMRHFQGSAKAIFGQSGERTGILLCYSDVTQLLQSRKDLRKSQSRYQSIVESSPSGIAIFGDDYRVRYVSPRTRKIFGYDGYDEMQPSIYDFIHESDRHSLDRFLEKVQESNSVEQSRFKAVDQQGEHFWLEAYASVRLGESGRNELVFILNDISKLLEVERELEAEKAIYQSLIANSFEGIDILEFGLKDKKFDDGTILIRNDVMHSILGSLDYDDEPQLRASLFPGYHQSGLSASSQVEQLWDLGVVSSSWRCKNAAGEVVLIDGVLRILEREERIFVVRIFRDVTQERASEQIIEEQMINLNEKNEELERYIESNLQLENFAYIASHDLKAPARSIGSFADLLARTAGTKLSDRENHFLGIILESSRNMLALIDDLLTYSRLNSQQISVKSIKPKALFDSILQDVSKDIESAGANVTFHHLPKSIEGDPIKLRQLFLNLISNSLKFKTPTRQPRVRVEWTSLPDYWKIDVKDNGIGIDEKYADKVFLLFQKLHSSDKYDGSGMGLAISKKIVDQHFGKIEVVPSRKGAHLTLTLAKDLAGLLEKSEDQLLDRHQELT